MKINLLVILFLSLAVQSGVFANSNDTFADKLRQEFLSGQTPTKKHLVLDGITTCAAYYASPKDGGFASGPDFRFTLHGNRIKNSHVNSVIMGMPEYFSFEPIGLVGIGNVDPNHTVCRNGACNIASPTVIILRTSKEGGLIGERSIDIKDDFLDLKNNGYPTSVYSPEYVVFHYIMCN